MAGPRDTKLTAPLVALLLLANGRAAPDTLLSGRTRPPDSSGARVVVFLRELCEVESLGAGATFETAEDYERGLLQYIRDKGVVVPSGVDLSFLPKSAVCETKSRGLSAILDALAQESTRALIGSLEEDLCDVTSRLADMWGKPLLSWSCPQVTRGTQRLVPSLEETANAIVALAKTLSWRSIVIITSDVGWWPVLANKVEVALQESGVSPRHLYWENQSLRGLHSSHARVIILCASLRSSTGETILQAIDSLKLSQTILLAIDVSSFIPFLPRIVTNNPTEGSIHDQLQNDAPLFEENIQRLPLNDDMNKRINIKPSAETAHAELNKHFDGNNFLINNLLIVNNNGNLESDALKTSAIKLNFTLNKFISDLMNRTVEEEIKSLKRNETKKLRDLRNKTTNVKRRNDESSKRSAEARRTSINSSIKYFHKNRTKTRHDTRDKQINKRKNDVKKLDTPPLITMSHHEEHDNISNVESHVEIATLNRAKISSYNGSVVNDSTQSNWILRENSFKVSPETKENSLIDTKDAQNASDNISVVSTTKTESNINFGDDFSSRWIQIGNVKLHSLDYDTVDASPFEFSDRRGVRRKRSWNQNRYEMFENISIDMKKSFMILTSMDSKNIVSDVFMEKSSRNELFEHILEGLKVVGESFENKTAKVFKFLFLDWKEEVTDNEEANAASHWRPLVILQSTKNATWKNDKGEMFHQGDVSLNILKVQPNFDDWFRVKGFEFEEDSCYGDFCIRGAQIKVNTTHIIIIVSAALLFSGFCIGIALIVRNFLLKKRLSKGPNKIVLTATDFVFPQVPDSRRVDEGIEAMLCCWLQQLQEFGGPEVDKPDLLKGSMGSLGAVGQPNNRGPSSNGSLAKNNYIIDHRIRYNGDLVQLKNLPSVGTFELKSKAMDCLVLTHGLRHENLNPFIGCLTDPTRPALVHEHCSRGSLEDVLMMDEIKLDWSFRLSLLTDLVRGMRYLHSTPLKVHGYLTSRNCVIDARWVLKVTDYGLPAFYEAQGIPAPAKNARDLLWTAPELLRHCGLRRRGSQPGDVYSFGIIMQEVVVRGEPFCMLALSPEEIIEKVKKPPPLIRPSVSKGAAPPEAIHIMRQCWTEQADMRPDFTQVHDLFRKLNHGRKVNFVDTMFQMLEKYSNNLEELIRERTEQLDMEKKKTEQLLNRMLPSYVADKLKLAMPVDPEEFSEVSIYFSDIVGFTAISAHSTPFQVVDLLNDLYTCFDATINAYNVYKVETIGDAYMVVGGLPVRVADHAEQVATMALDLLHQSGRFKIRHLPRTPLHLRIGLHTGPCCAGVVGLTMPRYCLFGDTVNTASRMESTGSAWRIHLSQTTRDKLDAAGGYTLEYRGRTEVKGKGKMPTYWLLGKAGFDKVLPSPPPIGENNCLEESLLMDRNPSPRMDELSSCEATGGQVSPCPPMTDCEKLSSNHFSIDRTFFSVEKPSSPSKPDRSMSLTAKVDHFLPRVINGERKKPHVLETPNNSQEQGDVTTIPTITTENDDPQETLDQITRTNELPITNILQQNKLHVGMTPLSQYTLGTPVSASEVAAALLGSSTSLVSNRYKDITKYKRSLMIDSHDLSTPYNHYRCLSPSDSNINQLNHGKILGGDLRQNTGRLLKRQFSLDRADDSGNLVPESNLAAQSTPKLQSRLCKQNSAGAAPDLERIEEVPLSMSTPKAYKRRLETTATFPESSKSVSSESLTLGH